MKGVKLIMEAYLIDQLRKEAMNFYRALIEGRPIDKARKRIQRLIRRMITIGISKSVIDDILSDAALKVC